ncbi:hypothetical protein NOVO_04430 [Rickettsiales bacterium Ac37b]|nr:hypothetical protein NOVO_04430 [Rickettsiales bacterium Ac37b]
MKMFRMELFINSASSNTLPIIIVNQNPILNCYFSLNFYGNSGDQAGSEASVGVIISLSL